MRLLNTDTLEVEVFMGSDVPTYAILSHTWGKNEVTLQDLAGNRSGSKKDFSKLDKTCKVAHANGYGYVWVDTCCIDKTSSAELSEAINSMFRYYQEADVCYAFLFDLVPEEVAPLESALATCRWFTRGWTLQELIASREIHIYDAAWSLRGTKRTMVDLISRISRVDREVLLDADELYCVPVAAKMSWAATRATTRIEDMAYSLLGIFDIHLPLLYGEGLKAFRRLQEEILRKTNDMSLLAWVPEDTEQQEG
ncbi:heterokaryon incompatibility protein-domain-containing protein, partial [Lasiosphaeria hispida]